MLDNAITIKPKRQMSVQFSGGEPTLSPYFLDAVAYSRKVGYNSVQAASNGIEFATVSYTHLPGGLGASPDCGGRWPALNHHSS